MIDDMRYTENIKIYRDNSMFSSVVCRYKQQGKTYRLSKSRSSFVQAQKPLSLFFFVKATVLVQLSNLVFFFLFVFVFPWGMERTVVFSSFGWIANSALRKPRAPGEKRDYAARVRGRERRGESLLRTSGTFFCCQEYKTSASDNKVKTSFRSPSRSGCFDSVPWWSGDNRAWACKFRASFYCTAARSRNGVMCSCYFLVWYATSVQLCNVAESGRCYYK